MLFYKHIFFLIAHNIFIYSTICVYILMNWYSVQEKVVHSHTESPKGFRNRLIGISRNNNNHLKGHMQGPSPWLLGLVPWNTSTYNALWNGFMGGWAKLAPPVIYHHMAEGPFSPSYLLFKVVIVGGADACPTNLISTYTVWGQTQ